MFSFLRKTIFLRTLFFVVADIFFIAVSVWLAFILRFDGNIPVQYVKYLDRVVVLAIIFTIPIFYFQKLYSFSWAYVSTNEAISLFKATTISFLFLGIVIFVSDYSPRFSNFPRSTIFISYILVFVFCGLVRFSKRIYSRLRGFPTTKGGQNVLIVGAGDAGEQILRSMMPQSNKQYSPIGFADDDPMKRGVLIHGLKVLGKISDIPKIAKDFRVKQLIIALPAAGNKKTREAVEFGKEAGIWKIKIVPPLSEIIKGQVSLKNLREVGVEDLLGRDEIVLDLKQIENFIRNKTILITGAAGSIGSELSKQVAKFNPKLLLLMDRDETGIFNISNELRNNYFGLKTESLIADVTDRKKIEKIFDEFKIEIVFHAAAYKHVPLMEQNPGEAVKNNVIGTKTAADISLNHGVEKFIFISTDKAVNPTSIMGATKRAGEMICQMLNQEGKTKFISVRFGNVLNSRGSVIPTFREQIKKGGPVEVTHPDMRRYFMLTSEACLLVMQASAMGCGGEVFVLDMGKPIKILDLAKEMIKLSGLQLNKDITIVFTKPRPGEKMFEEILTAEEGTNATQNQKIFVAKFINKDTPDLGKKIAALEKIAVDGHKESIVRALSDILPSFNHQG